MLIGYGHHHDHRAHRHFNGWASTHSWFTLQTHPFTTLAPIFLSSDTHCWQEYNWLLTTTACRLSASCWIYVVTFEEDDDDHYNYSQPTIAPLICQIVHLQAAVHESAVCPQRLFSESFFPWSIIITSKQNWSAAVPKSSSCCWPETWWEHLDQTKHQENHKKKENEPFKGCFTAFFYILSSTNCTYTGQVLSLHNTTKNLLCSTSSINKPLYHYDDHHLGSSSSLQLFQISAAQTSKRSSLLALVMFSNMISSISSLSTVIALFELSHFLKDDFDVKEWTISDKKHITTTTTSSLSHCVGVCG